MLENLGPVNLRLAEGAATAAEEESVRAQLEYALETLAAMRRQTPKTHCCQRRATALFSLPPDYAFAVTFCRCRSDAPNLLAGTTREHL